MKNCQKYTFLEFLNTYFLIFPRGVIHISTLIILLYLRNKNKHTVVYMYNLKAEAIHLAIEIIPKRLNYYVEILFKTRYCCHPPPQPTQHHLV